jgi:hypothetical protein
MVWIDTDGTSLVVITEFCGFIVVVVVVVVVVVFGDHEFYYQ